ncbi:MAG: hypothetical protein CLLPBCKN_003466 [Chroococcidiopsis cubana SAG 39.79]|uniref:2-oxoadipate dioxygenase/decarboxylase n=1 Tax=Chroococcidiopsis cubana SAG 39.79 TaxID=388085 RepID=A0AB37ULH2_9CYAN|nr:DUF1338 domain-containing protein [Chroococcidiopsis cubana]MDZ4874070.1 hypothetical protein [Chroococcidiopsis cubana SAG 39.79]PSB64408.1 DUF1338 domain-containing protein [Chroococcidiopsis cubana CCALA 043]RUT12221.1 DUF1338 domain-containing protein [Chroococcidiopsis cubana SAG 39.79]
MKAEIALHLWDRLWQQYRARVSYAQVYEQMILQAGGTVANDHIAFRSLRLNIDTPEGKQNLGIEYLASVAEALGYTAAGEYIFPAQKLYARHYQHPEQEQYDLPKLFISELIVEELPEAIASLIYQTVSDASLGWAMPSNATNPTDIDLIVDRLQGVFTRPWSPPKQSVVEEVNRVTQYGAWVLLHGYAVNHFTGYVNRQHTLQYPDIETTANGLATLGVPMKAQIEGSLEVGLRQTATHAVKEMVTVIDDVTGELMQIPWTYAYYEIAERYPVEAVGKKVLFDAFLGQNAQHLFEMTKKVSS